MSAIPESRTFELRPVELRGIVRRLVKHRPGDEFERYLTALGWGREDAAELRLAVEDAYNRVCAPARGRR